MSSISADEIRILTQYIHSISGVSLDASKAYLLETRLKHLMQKHGCATYLDLHATAKADRGGNVEKEIIDAITTNETLFFRDATPFEVFKHKILPDLIDARSKAFPGRPVPLRIWSAACSTGQEVYSIAIALREALGNLNGYQISILGTDISDDAVSKASYGKYNKFEIERGLPASVLNRYFLSTGDGWRIKDELRAMVMFKKFNLMKSFAGLGKFDVVFCRNVAIYFTPADKKMVFEKIAGVLEADGTLIIGSTESLTGVTGAFEPKRYLRSIFYQPVSGGRPAPAPAPSPVAAVRPMTAPPSIPRPPAPPVPRPSLALSRPSPAPAPPGVASPPPISTTNITAEARTAALTTPPLASPVPEYEPAAEISEQPVQAVRSPRPTAPRPAVRTSGPSHAGDKSALKRLLLQKKQAAKA